MRKATWLAVTPLHHNGTCDIVVHLSVYSSLQGTALYGLVWRGIDVALPARSAGDPDVPYIYIYTYTYIHTYLFLEPAIETLVS